jgi:hypothetical protein
MGEVRLGANAASRYGDFSGYTYSIGRSMGSSRSIAHEKDLPELFQPKRLPITSEKRVRSILKLLVDPAISLPGLSLSVLEIRWP